MQGYRSPQRYSMCRLGVFGSSVEISLERERKSWAALVWNLEVYTTCSRLVPDDTVQKGTSKHHKMDEKITHFAVHVLP